MSKANKSNASTPKTSQPEANSSGRETITPVPAQNGYGEFGILLFFRKHRGVIIIILLFMLLEVWVITIPTAVGFFTGSEQLLVDLRYWLLLVLLIILSFTYRLFDRVAAKNVSEIKTLFEVIALLFAGVYFAFKLWENLQITALALEVKDERIPGANYDHLSVTLILKKTGHTPMDLHHVKGYIYDVVGTDRLIDTLNFITTRYKANTFGDAVSSISDALDSEHKYRLATDESTQFSAYKEVEKKPYRIEVVVIGRRTKFFHKVNPQFRASIISLPSLRQQTSSN